MNSFRPGTQAPNQAVRIGQLGQALTVRKAGGDQNEYIIAVL